MPWQATAHDAVGLKNRLTRSAGLRDPHYRIGRALARFQPYRSRVSRPGARAALRPYRAAVAASRLSLMSSAVSDSANACRAFVEASTAAIHAAMVSGITGPPQRGERTQP
jgi:hypothetical protein